MPHDATRRALLLGSAAAALGAWPAATATAASGPFGDALHERLRREGVGFAAAQLDAAGLRLQVAGVKRWGDPAPIETGTLFELGSLTKAFVALLFADGVLRKDFAADDPVETGLPDGIRLRDRSGQPLRLLDLATHRSGLPRMPGNLLYNEIRDPYPFYTEARMFDFLREWRADVDRGERFEYSNFGYGLLAQVLARRLGTDLDAALRSRVLLPLGLDDLRIARPLPAGDDLARIGAALAASWNEAARLAAPHRGDRRPAIAWRFDAMAGAVGLLGSIESVGRFLQAAVGAFDHPLREAFAMCLQYRTEGEHPLHPFGFGWELSTIVGHDDRRLLFNQDGATSGFSSSVWLEPRARRAAAVLANAFIETRSLALHALDSRIDESDFNLVALDATVLQRLTGRWRFTASNFALAIRWHRDRLWMQAAAQPEFELVPVTGRRLVARDSTLEFAFDDGDPPRRMTMKRDGRLLAFERAG